MDICERIVCVAKSFFLDGSVPNEGKFVWLSNFYSVKMPIIVGFVNNYIYIFRKESLGWWVLSWCDHVTVHSCHERKPSPLDLPLQHIEQGSRSHYKVSQMQQPPPDQPVNQHKQAMHGFLHYVCFIEEAYRTVVSSQIIIHLGHRLGNCQLFQEFWRNGLYLDWLMLSFS